MKKPFFLLFFLVLLNGNAQVKEYLTVPKNAKVGLSLSGGGAKGFAHIGVLKVIDSLGVKIDYISGTSMGAIVGGLYAAGYTANDIEKIVMNTDFYTLIANEKTRQETTFFNKSTDKYLFSVPIKDGKINVLPKSISTGQKNIYMLKELFKNVSTVNDFSKLPIPFICIGTNLESGKMKVFEEGDLVTSIMASSAFPSLMDPVKIGDSLYIDGAMTVNYPSKQLKDKGMDIVIGVDLSQGLASREQLNSLIDILNQVIDFGIQEDTKRQYDYTDINIHPNLKGMSATNYDEKEKILNLGLDEAQNYTPVLSKLPKREIEILRAPINPIFSNVYKIDSLLLENNKIFNEDYVLGKMNLRIPSLQTYGSINKMVDKLYATNNYTLVNYDIVQHGEKNENYLKILVTEDDTRFFLKFGLHYDEIFKTGFLVNATAKRLLFKNSIISLDAVVGDKPRYYFNYFVDNGYIPGFGLYSSGMEIDLRNKEDERVDEWLWFRNDVFIQSIWRDKYAIGGGLSHDYYESYNNLYLLQNFFNPYLFIRSDTQDDKDFPTRGIYLNAEGKTLDLFNNEVEDKSIQIKSRLKFNLPINKRITYQMGVFGGFSIGPEIPDFYKFRPGGIFEQNLGNFSRFEGYPFGYLVNDNVLSAHSYLQFKIKKNIFLTGNFNIINLFDKITIEDVLRINESSAGISAGYKSPFGQIKVNYSKAFNNDNNGFFNVILGHWF